MNKIALAAIAKFENVLAMKSAVNKSGSHFFDPFYVDMLHSKIEGPLLSESFFITSEYREDPAERKFTARYFTAPNVEGGRYEDVMIGEFQQYGSVAEAKAAIWEFQANLSASRQVETILREAGGLEYFEAESGYMWLRREDGRGVLADIFGRGTVLNRSGVKLHAKDDVYEVPVGDFNTPRRFGEYVRSLADKMIEGGSDLA